MLPEISLGHSFCLPLVDNGCGMMTLTFIAVVNPDEATLCKVIEESARSEVFKQDLKMVMVDELHRCQTILMLQNDYGPQWTREAIHVWNQYCCDGRKISTAEATMVSKVVSTWTATVQHDASYKDVQRSMVKYVHTFGGEYNVSSLDA